MPLVAPKFYRPVPLHVGGHLQTILPSLFRKVKGIQFTRERIDTPDGDFLDLDWVLATPGKPSSRLLVVSHGLEGDTQRHYVTGMARLFLNEGWDVLAWNCRSCSGEMNRLLRLYHHGDTPDLGLVVRHGISKHGYTQVGLTGISLGGNLTMKYLGEDAANLPKEVIGGVGLSVPIDLRGSEEVLALPSRKIYFQRFIKKLHKKLQYKAERFPGAVDLTGFEQIKRFRDFDARYTAPIHGFASADDYYARAASGPYLAGIDRPALVINAANDPFLSEGCFPTTFAATHPFFHLEIPNEGGHVGFMERGQQASYAERRALEFLLETANSVSRKG